MFIKRKIIDLLNKLPYIRGLHNKIIEFEQLKKNSCFDPGHFHSPIIDICEIKKREDVIWKKKLEDKISGIDLNTEYQLSLIKKFENYYKDIPYLNENKINLKYQFDNDFYSYTDAITLYSIIREFKPKKIIEVGSGYSSALMLDTNRQFYNDKINLTFIEPNPERLFSLINECENRSANIIKDNVQNVPLKYFASLVKNDILFIDSSHVVKTDSDLNYILFDVLPILNPGVLIHFHDIFYPFEYPKDWVLKGQKLE